MSYHRIAPLVVGILGLLGSSAGVALDPFGATPQETALCSALVYGGKDRDANVRMEPGVGWEHTHHWCDCVRLRYRAIKAIGKKAEFSHNLNEAIGGCDYVIRAAKPGFRMLPKVHVDRGRALKLRGDTGEAVLAFQKAISLDPKEINAYSELSLIQEERGQKVAARETVALGLQHNPESKLLQKRYLELGGKEPFPEAFARDAQAPVPPAASPDSSGESALPETLDLDPQEPVIAVDAQSESAAEAGSQSAEDEKAATDVSARSCRFCPPEEIQRRWIESFKTGQQKKPE